MRTPLPQFGHHVCVEQVHPHVDEGARRRNLPRGGTSRSVLPWSLNSHSFSRLSRVYETMPLFSWNEYCRFQPASRHYLRSFPQAGFEEFAESGFCVLNRPCLHFPPRNLTSQMTDLAYVHHFQMQGSMAIRAG